MSKRLKERLLAARNRLDETIKQIEEGKKPNLEYDAKCFAKYLIAKETVGGVTYEETLRVRPFFKGYKMTGEKVVIDLYEE